MEKVEWNKIQKKHQANPTPIIHIIIIHILIIID